MRKALLLLLMLPFLGNAQNASELLVRWEGTRINWGNPSAGPMYYNSSSANMTAGNFTGPNVNLNITYSGFQGEGWTTATTPDYTKYFQVSVAPATGKKIEAKSFRFQQTGYCNRYQIRYSTNPAFPDNGTLLYESTNALATQSTYINAAFPAGFFVNSGETLYIRIYGYERNQYNNPWKLIFSEPVNNTANTNGVAPGFYGVISNASVVVATNDSATTVQGFSKNVNVLANDTYTGTSISSVEILSQPANGSAVLQPDNTITFTPAPGFTGNTSFQYKITGANATTSTATVNINVTAMVVPVSNTDSATTEKNTQVIINVLNNDVVGTGAITAVNVVATPANGNAVVNADKTITYTPALNYTGNDSFTYKITDEYNNTSTSTVNITVTFPAVTGALCGTYVIGTTAQSTYPQFQTITQAISHLNANGVSCAVTFLLNDNVYSNGTGETFPITLNAFTGSSATNTVTIKPAPGVNAAVEASNINSYTAVPAVLKLNGADNIIIDGSNTEGDTTRNLTLNNKDIIDYAARTVIWVASVGSNNGATNITVKNTNLRQAVKNAAGTFCVGVYSGASNTGDDNAMAVAVSAGDNANLKVVNNDFMNVKQGVYINGSASTPTTNVVVHQNDLGAENNTETIIQPACFSNVNGFEYTENLVYNLYRNSTAGDLTSAGIFITGNTRNGYILRNTMRKLTKTHTDGYTFAGITLASTSNNSNIVVANNFILNVAGMGNSDARLNGHGINIASGGGYKIYHNTVRLQDNQATAGYSSALFVNAGVLNTDIRNNIFVNLQTTGSRRTAIMVRAHKNQVNNMFSFLDYNNYYSLDQLGYIANANDINQIDWPQNPDYLDTLPEWKATTGKDANSLNINPEFVSATNLHLTTNNFSLDNLGTPIAGVTKDIDGQLRSTSTPDMGADEFGAMQLGGGGSNAGIYCASSTTWDGTAWSNGNPTADKDAIFTGNFTQNGGTFYACSIFVQGTAQVLFSGNSNAVVTHNVNVEATANVTFESGSNLIQVENTQNIGNVTIKRFGSRLKKLDYTFWSSPVTGTQTLQEFSPATMSNRFYTYNTATSTYLSVASPSTTPFTTARGYLIRMPNSITGPQATAYNAGGYRFAFEGIFTGVPNNGNIYIPLTHTPSTGNYNSVGNPYPSPISVTDFIDANIDNIEGTIWVWRKDNNPNATSYGTITKMGYTANAAAGGSNNGNGNNGNGNNGNGNNGNGLGNGNDLLADPFTIHSEGILNTGQGFIVKAKTNQDLVFRNNMRLSTNYNNFFRSAETTDAEPTNALVASRLWLNVTNAAEDVFSQTLIGYTAQATMGYDNGIDGKGFVDGTVALYTVIEDYKLAIQGRPSFVDTDIVPLGFKTETAGEYIIHLDHVNGIFEGEQDIYIKDKATGAVHDIKEGDYTFTSEVGTFEDRFEVIYLKENSELGNGNTGLIAQEVKVYRNGSQIKIDAPEEIQAVTVFDVQGKTIYQNNAVSSLNFTSTAITATQQMLIVNIQFANGQLVSKKIMMN